MENGKEVGIVVPGADNAVQESLGNDDMNRGDVEPENGAGAGSEKNAEMADTRSGEEEGKEQA